MASATDIANLIAIKIGAEARITALDDDRPVARAIRAVWDMQRSAALRDGAWNFATRRAELAAEYLPSGTPYPWQSSFPLPADALRLIEVLNLRGREDYQLEGRSILCNLPGPLYIRYLIDVTEPALWDDLFVEVFACRMALNVGPRIGGSNYSIAAGESALMAAISAAKRVDARENPPMPMEESGWISARFGGRSAGSSGGWF